MKTRPAYSKKERKRIIKDLKRRGMDDSVIRIYADMGKRAVTVRTK